MYEASAPSPARLAWLQRRKRRSRTIRLWQIALLVLLFGLWELSTALGLSDGFLISSPSRMAATLVQLCRSGEILVHVGTSCLETAVGFLAGTALGTLIAVAMWWSDTLARILDPYLVVLNALPKTALGPIFIVWMGAGGGAIITMTLAISLIVTVLDMYSGFRETDRDKIRLLRTLGARRRQIFTKLVLPASLPTMANALRVNVGLSWVGVIMGEFLVSRRGLGYLIVYGSQVFKMDLVMTTVLILAAAAALMYVGFLSTDPEKLRLMRSLGARRGQILWMLVFPANYPTLFNTLKVNVGLSWVGVIMGEFLVSRAGLGYLIVYGSQVFNMDLVMASVLVLAAAAVLMYRLVLLCEKLLYHYWGLQ